MPASAVAPLDLTLDSRVIRINAAAQRPERNVAAHMITQLFVQGFGSLIFMAYMQKRNAAAIRHTAPNMITVIMYRFADLSSLISYDRRRRSLSSFGGKLLKREA